MPKNIVLLSDGTGNSAAKLFKTNVWRLYQALELSRPDEQIAFYDDGVGTSSFKPLAILGGAFGYGLKRNVLDIYTFLCRNYESGDRIYCFGFSRGAFTVRVLAGLIHAEGLVRASGETELRHLATAAFRQFRREHFHSALRFPEKIGRAVRDLFVDTETYKKKRPEQIRPGIYFLGLWDTVAAYGLPIDELTRAWNWVFPLSVPDREPLPDVRICHAVAIDDERNTFHPVLFNEESLPANASSTNINQERVTQVWFSGMHSNIGGGYPDDGISFLTLDWMMRQAENIPGRIGLILKPLDRALARSSALALGKLYDSRRGVGGFYRYLPRKMQNLVHDVINPRDRVIVQRPKIHESVIERIRQGTDQYSPIVLPPGYAVVKDNGDIVNQPQAFEDPSQAQNRVNLQEKIWNLVWCKRIAYFSSIITFCFLLAFPLWRETTQVCVAHSPVEDYSRVEGVACLLTPVIAWAGAFLPSFASTWLDAFESYPFTFALLAILFALFLWIGARLQGRICDGMNRIWAPIRANPGTPTPVISPVPADLVYRYRTSSAYQMVFRTMKGFVLPLLVGIAAAGAILQTASRLAFQVASSGGFVCSASAGSELFSTDSVCWFTGYHLQEGGRYQISFRRRRPWYDATTPATLNGVRPKDTKLYSRLVMGSSVLMRRVVREPWFKPIARIGADGNDLYPLDPDDFSRPDTNTDSMAAEITARREGDLFLFVNDAVLPLPEKGQIFYHNNCGTATVTVKDLTHGVELPRIGTPDSSQPKQQMCPPEPASR